MAPIFGRKKQREQVQIPLDVLLKSRPVRNPALEWSSEGGRVILTIKLPPSKPGLFSGFVKQPTERRIALDEVGSYVWELMDGQRSIGEIAEMLASRFKLHPREAQASLLAYIGMLGEKGLVYMTPPAPQPGSGAGEGS